MPVATKPYELTRLDPNTFEHMANQIAARVLGSAATGFGPGSDGGRDGWFEGEANYPSEADRWSGTWYIQAKFHSPSLSGNAQQWLQGEIRKELDAFSESSKGRVWPDNWIIVTNVDPSATPKTGTFDRVNALVKRHNKDLAKRTHIWGGEKVLAFLNQYPEIGKYYAGFTTSGEVLSAAIDAIGDRAASFDAIVRDLVVTQFIDQQFTKLEQAGSTADTRPGIHKLFVDLPYKTFGGRAPEKALKTLVKASAENFGSRLAVPRDERWQQWLSEPVRSKVWFIRGGPGQGKSTLTQYMCQIQRAALISSSADRLLTSQRISEVIGELKACAIGDDYWPAAARIPVQIELRLYAQWYGDQERDAPKGFLTFLSSRLTKSIEQKVLPGTLRRIFGSGRWLFVFDGLDEVPGDVKDEIANEISGFVDNTLIEAKCEALIVCTSRPQGYSGQFDVLEPAIVDLDQLQPKEALDCAIPVLAVDRGREDLANYTTILREALSSPAIQEIMTTPLQSHIMAVVVRDGGRPPERRWQLFNNFYQVIKKREANRNLADRNIAMLLRDGDKLIKTLHNRLGFELHYRAERSSGAQTSINKHELRDIVLEIVNSLQSSGISETVETLMEATTERLVLVSTPENGSSVRFDIRPLQEFFAAEYLYESAPDESFMERLQVIAGDSHWREVLHFLLSALVEQGRRVELAQAVQVLIGLDEPADAGGRPLARSLCLGGAIAGRLVREGVLESDKRVRHLFQPCTSALLAATEARNLTPFVGPPHSRDWLTSLVLSTVSESSSQENVGAAILSPALLADYSEESVAVSSFIAAQPIEYRNVFIRKTAGFYGSRGYTSNVPIWVLRYVVRELSRESWHELDAVSLKSAYQILSCDSIRTNIAMTDEGISSDVAEILAAAFPEDEDARHAGENDSVIHGAVICSVSPGVDALISENWSEQQAGELSNLTGLFGLIAWTSLASADRLGLSMKTLEQRLNGKVQLLERLPSLVVDMFLTFQGPHDPERDDEKVCNVVRVENAGQRRLYLIHQDDDKPVDWYGLSTSFPRVIPTHLSRGYQGLNDGNLIEWLRSDEALAHVLKGLAEYKDALPALSDMTKLMDVAPRLATGILEIMETLPSELFMWQGYGVRPFPLVVAERRKILPHLLICLTNSYHNGAIYADDLGNRRQATLNKLVRDFGFSLQDLSQITKGGCDDNHVNLAASVISIAYCDESEENLEPILLKIMDYLKERKFLYLLPTIFALLSGAIKTQSPIAKWFVNEALQKARPELSVRVSLEPILSEWREITRSPVLSSMDRQIWT
jgi:hypothetical protein